ncbi:TPA: 23S rRNA methyltransferase attenuation leader peptide, partial [Klebsiella pneumoniae]|nr:23S rRNA methyltransferase attenuation leader peptide [Klebsiella pneumoniae]
KTSTVLKQTKKSDCADK